MYFGVSGADWWRRRIGAVFYLAHGTTLYVVLLREIWFRVHSFHICIGLLLVSLWQRTIYIVFLSLCLGFEPEVLLVSYSLSPPYRCQWSKAVYTPIMTSSCGLIARVAVFVLPVLGLGLEMSPQKPVVPNRPFESKWTDVSLQKGRKSRFLWSLSCFSTFIHSLICYFLKLQV
jgi:hypothetical protein